MYGYKIGIHRYVFSFYYDEFSEKLVPDARSWVRVKVSPDLDKSCSCKITPDGICNCGSSQKYPYAEKELIKQLENQKPTVVPMGKDNFHTLIKRALGWESLKPKSNLGVLNPKFTKIDDYGDGRISELIFQYQTPKISTRALYAEHVDKSHTLAVILHGQGTTMQKTMGLDTPDYMNAIGGYWFDKGFDVIAFATTGNMGDSSTLNRLLRFYKITVYGLWTKSICHVVGTMRAKYKKIYVYGLSNGGTIADLLSVTCDPFDLVIVGDTFVDWGTRMWREHKTSSDHILYWVHPFVSQTSIFDLMRNTKSKKVYTTSEKNYLALDKKIQFQEIELSSKNKVNVLFKTRMEHTPEIRIMENLFKGSLDGLEGVGIDTATK